MAEQQKKLPTKAELLAQLDGKDVHYRESELLNEGKLNGFVVTAGETSRVTVRAGADSRTKRRTMQRVLDTIDNGKAAAHPVVLLGRRTRKPDLIN